MCVNVAHYRLRQQQPMLITTKHKQTAAPAIATITSRTVNKSRCEEVEVWLEEHKRSYKFH